MWVAYLVAGLICCVLIITIPWGIACFRVANYALWPFGREVVSKPNAGGWSVVGNVIWFVVAGFWLSLGQIEKAGRLTLARIASWIVLGTIVVMVAESDRLKHFACRIALTMLQSSQIN